MNEQELDPLGVLADAHARAGEALELASRYLDPSLVEVLRILGFDKSYRSASGSYLYDEAGRAYLDMHSGEGFASVGHGHPDIKAVLRATLDSDLIDGVQLHYSVLSGMLAEALGGAPACGTRRSVLCQYRRRGRGQRDEVRARRHRPSAVHLMRLELSWRDARSALDRR